MARRLSTILPAMPLAEAMETTRLHRVAGLIGGGHVPLPGEGSLAHHGVRFLDELPALNRHVFAVWRCALEEDVVTIARVSMGIMP